MKMISTKKTTGSDDFTEDLYQTFKEGIISLLQNISLKNRKGENSCKFIL